MNYFYNRENFVWNYFIIFKILTVLVVYTFLQLDNFFTFFVPINSERKCL